MDIAIYVPVVQKFFVIEVHGDTKEINERRKGYLEYRGFEVIDVRNWQVRADVVTIAQWILDEIERMIWTSQ